MKKYLLLLACCLLGWGGVQAVQMIGQAPADSAPAVVEAEQAPASRLARLDVYQVLQGAVKPKNPNPLSWPALEVRPDHVRIDADTAIVDTWADVANEFGVQVRSQLRARLVRSSGAWVLVDLKASRM